jgi:hypothetical protein
MFDRAKSLAEKYLREGMMSGDKEPLITGALAKLSSASGHGSHGAVIDHARQRLLVSMSNGCHRKVRWSRNFGQGVKLGSALRRTDLNDGQTEAVFGGFQGESCS